MKVEGICSKCKTINTINIEDIKADILGKMNIYETIDDIHDAEVKYTNNTRVSVKYTCKNDKCKQRNEITVTINRK